MSKSPKWNYEIQCCNDEHDSLRFRFSGGERDDTPLFVVRTMNTDEATNCNIHLDIAGIDSLMDILRLMREDLQDAIAEQKS